MNEERKEGFFSRIISGIFERNESRDKVLINKKKHIWTAILFGWAGAHRFQTKRPILGLLYLATCWTGYSVAMTIIDLLTIVFLPTDENGNILI